MCLCECTHLRVCICSRPVPPFLWLCFLLLSQTSHGQTHSLTLSLPLSLCLSLTHKHAPLFPSLSLSVSRPSPTPSLARRHTHTNTRAWSLSNRVINYYVWFMKPQCNSPPNSPRVLLFRVDTDPTHFSFFLLVALSWMKVASAYISWQTQWQDGPPTPPPPPPSQLWGQRWRKGSHKTDHESHQLRFTVFTFSYQEMLGLVWMLAAF